jgi:hypothetical protein
VQSSSSWWGWPGRFILNPDNAKAFLTGAEEKAPDEPDRTPPGWPRAEPVPPREYAWVNNELGQVERILFDGAGGCGHCHVKADPPKRPDGLPAYRLTDIKDRWYEKSVFRHDSHKMLACGECHPAAGSTTAGGTLLPRIDNCRQCHNAQVKARTDCVECLAYHDPAKRREFKGGLTIDQLTKK